MSKGFGVMQRTILETVHAIIDAQHAQCAPHPEAPLGYRTSRGAPVIGLAAFVRGLCSCQAVSRPTLQEACMRTLTQRGAVHSGAVHAASFGRALIALVRAGHLRCVWPREERRGGLDVIRAVTLPEYLRVKC
jgi:hypothetical protein